LVGRLYKILPLGQCMEIVDERRENVRMVSPAGRIDSVAAPVLARHLSGTEASGQSSARALVVDLSAVEYISSAGLAVLLGEAKATAGRDGTLVLCGLGDGVREVFSLAGLLPLFTIEPTREAAMTRVGCTPAGRDR
jgi:stage II sporulation protein AA (anti-sigma F factor antagonist)